MMMFARRVASVLMLGLGLSGTLGCELIAAVDHSLLDVDAGLPPGTGGEGGVGGQGGSGGSGGNGGTGGSAVVCGDGEVGTGEGCDDGNVTAGDGCDATCAIELGYSCVGEPSVCSTDCGDGNVSGSEACDDGDNDAGDGCDPACVVEVGYSCTGEPSVCVTSCGDGIIVGTEECDDSNMAADDGCDDVCAVEPGYMCTGEPSACVTSCGDGIIAGAEECDDQNTDAADGCDGMCVIEPGYSCVGEPSVCTPGCGDGIIAGGEECDDSNMLADDGCGPSCDVENGFVCMGMPSVCTAVCGDGIIAGGEECDDDGTAGGDGCSATCAVEDGYTCENMPSMCAPVCGDGLIVGGEECDDSDTSGGDGCSAMCGVEDGFSCAGMPSVCTANCGDGVVLGAETCDDGGVDAGDGCSAACLIEPGYSCAGMPSMCTPICGDGMVLAGEDCDDGDTDDADGCSAICTVEMGYGCLGSPSVCTPICGDGSVIAPETCDDGDADSGDGCSSACLLEPGFSCVGVPTVCTEICGDGLIVGTEACDDGGTTGGDGCSAMCATEPGYACMGTPSVCMTVCGDGILTPITEACDDGNNTDGDCCSAACAIEPGCELEPNDTLATAMDWDVLNIGGQMQGFVTPASDLDYYSFTVPDGTTGTVTAESLDGPLGSTCIDNEVDTLITIHNSGGMQLAVDDDQGPGFCSIVTVTGLLPGEYYVRVKNSPQDPDATFDYTLALTITLSPCGNGLFELGEQCDDGNMANGDGCNGFCKLECVPEVEPNGTSATANGPFTPSNELGSFHCAAISPIGDQDYYRIDLPATADLRIQTFDLNGPSTCVGGQVPILTLRAADGTTILATGVNMSPTAACKVINSTTVPAARHLPAGTYYVRVEDSGNNSLIPGYTLLVTYNALCGDGVVEGYEECDGGPTCGPTCDRIPSCGDGFIDVPETCDDGNMAGGDGCSGACVFETLAEVEPNGTLLDADARALDPSPILITGDRRIAGAISAVGDQDVFRVELAAPQVVRFEVFDGAGFDCGGLTTNMRVFNSAGLDVKFDTGLSEVSYAGGIGTGAGGQGRCSALVINLAAGTYYVRVEETSNDATIAAYQLQVKVLTYLGSEVEPNETPAQATPLTGTDIAIFGNHQVNLDVDYYTLTVPQGASIRIETVEGDAETCEFNGVDTTVSLHDSTGTQIVEDTNQGRGDCSLIDGTGVSTPNDPAAHTLNAGTYYIRVRSTSGGLAGQFNYHLAITVRFP